jgi:cytochrome c553
MSRFLSVALAVALFAVPAFAAEAPAGAQKIPAKNGDISFDHAKHKDVACNKCHADDKGAKIEFAGGADAQKKWHGVCVECHKTSGKATAPTKCTDCHKKA